MSRLFATASVAASVAMSLAAAMWFAAPANAESVMKDCGAEWKTAKASNATNGQTWKEFLKDCRARHESGAAAPTPVATTAAVAPAPAPVAPAPVAPAPVAPKPTPTRMAKVSPAATGAGEFTTEAEAKGRCPADTVVWVNTKSHKYHYAGHRSYGTTKQGAYSCEADAKASGDVAAKGEKPKT